MNIEIDDRETWPKAFAEVAERQKALVVSYHKEHSRIDKTQETDVLARIRPEKNCYEANYNSLVSRLEPHLTNHKLVAYHCTRFTQNEISRVNVEGLKTLSPDFVRNRLKHCHDDGYLNNSDFTYLTDLENVRAKLQDRHGNRAGMIWFITDRAKLREEYGVSGFFKYWGGEVLFFLEKDREKTKRILSMIGNPSIVECAVPFSQVHHYEQNFSEYFLSRMVAEEIDCPEPPPISEFHTKHAVSGSDILGIHTHPGQEFERLTGFSSWR